MPGFGLYVLMVAATMALMLRRDAGCTAALSLTRGAILRSARGQAFKFEPGRSGAGYWTGNMALLPEEYVGKRASFDNAYGQFYTPETESGNSRGGETVLRFG